MSLVNLLKTLSYHYAWLLCKLKKRVFIILCLILVVLVILLFKDVYRYYKAVPYVMMNTAVSEFFNNRRQSWETSNLGSMLYKDLLPDDMNLPAPQFNTFVVLIWKYKLLMKNRGIKYSLISSLNDCEVQNCIISGDEDLLDSAHAVVVNLNTGFGLLPPTNSRSPSQRWIFWTDKSPNFMFPYSNRLYPENFDGVFNWSMSYRTSSDIPVPYGRTIRRLSTILLEDDDIDQHVVNLIPYWKRKRNDILVSAMLTDCNNTQVLDFVEGLGKYVKINVFGNCFKEHSKGNITYAGYANYTALSEYFFTITYEDDSCMDYITHNIFYNAYSKGSIPIILGTTIVNCQNLLPPNSYIHQHLVESPSHLAKEITETAVEIERIFDYHVWRNYFEVKNEHGYYNTTQDHFCRICEALNYNDQSKKVYSVEDLNPYFLPQYTCDVN